MCMVDMADERVIVLHERQHKARIEHKCRECGRNIRVGEHYTVERYVFDGSATSHKTCSHCMVVRDWLSAECGGFLYGSIEEDIVEHAREGYGIEVIKLAVGMRRNWTTRKGTLMSTPKLPITTHQEMGMRASA